MADRFQQSYLSGDAPWDIGAPQPAFVTLAESGAIRGRVLDVGCGTGENALYLASVGRDVVGVDGAPEAIRIARSKAASRGIDVRFEVGDVLDLRDHAGSFDSAIDSGVFHTFDDDDRPRYMSSVGGALHPGGRLFLMCFSELQPGTWGPRRVTQAEIRGTFSEGWQVDSIEPAHFRTTIDDAQQVQAWLASLTRSGDTQRGRGGER